jgi:hypothetical protein
VYVVAAPDRTKPWLWQLFSVCARLARRGQTNRVWGQLLPADQPIELPLYVGRIDPHR